MARVRSPNYPAMSLPKAIERVRALHAKEGRNPMPREAIAKHLGFTSLNGASLTALSALAKYGLLDNSGDGEARVSERAINILYPDDDAQKADALRDAAYSPALFVEINEKWPDRAPADESLRAFLVKKGFSQGALDAVIQIYRETIDMVGAKPSAQSGSQSIGQQEPPAMQQGSANSEQRFAPPPPPPQPTEGRPFAVSFDGTVITGTLALKSVRDIERLVKVLNAQKAALEAMQDEPDPMDGPMGAEDL